MYYLRFFSIPALILVVIGLGLLLSWTGLPDSVVHPVLMSGIAIGSIGLIADTVRSLWRRQFALDYIALLAISVGVISQQYYVALIIVLMLTGGTTLEKYAVNRAKRSLTQLKNRIPHHVILHHSGDKTTEVPIQQVKKGDFIKIRSGEVIPLDGILWSQNGLVDESSLTGEPVPAEKIKGDNVHSGTVNAGDVLIVNVTKTHEDSMYSKIIHMVEEAQQQKAPLIRLADRYSTFFTLITFLIAGATYWFTSDLQRVLSVLVIATPCPLILATPIALVGGVNTAAKKGIIIKNLASLESLATIDTLVLDKTGTITLGKPVVSRVEIINKAYTTDQVLAFAAALERNSLHPLAKAIVDHAKSKHIAHLSATKVHEYIGTGIEGIVDGKTIMLRKTHNTPHLSITISDKDRQIANIIFSDTPKHEAAEKLHALKKSNIHLLLFTGDKDSSARQLVAKLGLQMEISADMSPEDKKNGILVLKKNKKKVAMVGDGINDAPALALADVGMVFGNHEQTAATEAADIVFLGNSIGLIADTLQIGRKTIHIALQSILTGITLSIIGMIFASFGWIPAIAGAMIQEVLDVGVILNALRTNK